ncbi:hypothetical protein AWENTII_007982 [Aspergillus wentii]
MPGLMLLQMVMLHYPGRLDDKFYIAASIKGWILPWIDTCQIDKLYEKTMSRNILITGASGYLGGTLLARWKSAQLPPYSKLYALVRSEEQGEAVKQYEAEPLIGNLKDHGSIIQSIVSRKITIIYFLVDAYSSQYQPAMIQALGEVKKQTGQEVHFLHTTGAKQFSRHAGISTEYPLLDTDPKLYDIQKDAVTSHEFFVQSMKTNRIVIDTAEEYGVRSYIFAPCIVYGEGEGFGNRISIQDVAIVKAAKKIRQVYKVDSDHPTWPVCHIIDTINLYLHILRKILTGDDIGHGKHGYFLAASGSMPWEDIYSAMAKALAKRGIVDYATVKQADDAALAQMGKALEVEPSDVPVLLGGKCTFTAVHGQQIGWKAQYPPEHILEAADDEVELILKSLEVDDSRTNVR